MMSLGIWNIGGTLNRIDLVRRVVKMKAKWMIHQKNEKPLLYLYG